MIAALPMYDLPELRPVTDRFWAAIRDRLRAAGMAAPEFPERDDDLMAGWLSPDLVLSQTCGLPYRAHLRRRVDLVGTPDYGLPGCPPGYYRSVFVARVGDPRDRLADFDGASFAFNSAGSQSGWAAPVAHLQVLGLSFLAGHETGAHRTSAQAVAAGLADFAALDAVSFALLTGREPALEGLKVVGQTDPGPGLPMITARGRDAGAIFAAVAEAIDALRDEDRAALHLHGIVRIQPETYLAQPIPPNPQAFRPASPA